jgi:hypothetical protein
MGFKHTRLALFEGKSSTQGHRSAVSLHSHTRHSRENLAFIPHYVSRAPFLSKLFQKWTDRYYEVYGHEVDFSKGYWTPPLSAPQVYESEREQIEREVGLQAMVSLTDHDDIEASSQVQVLDESKEVPISLEWTVPFAEGFFHVGVHNLPHDRAAELMKELAAYTSHPDETRLTELFMMLDELPDTLVVLNHPLWDIEFAGAERHEALLKAFLEKCGEWIHALEINGYRTWQENKGVLRLAEELGYVVVSGGDRHGCDANAVLNLTRAEALPEFIAEVRRDKRSEITLMPEYLEPLLARQLKGCADVVRLYPDYPVGQQRWIDRVYFDINGVHPLPHYWPRKGAPIWVKRIVKGLCAAGSYPIQPMLRLALFNRKRTTRREIAGESRPSLYIQETQLDS